jgi:phage FluMu protein Com
MEYHLLCPSCSRSLTADEEIAGRMVNCPQCGTVLAVVSATEAALQPHVSLEQSVNRSALVENDPTEHAQDAVFNAAKGNLYLDFEPNADDNTDARGRSSPGLRAHQIRDEQTLRTINSIKQ